MLVDPARVDVSGGEIGMRQDVLEERDVGGDAFQPELAEGPRRPPRRAREVRRVDDDLGEQRVERVARAIARVPASIGAHARPARWLVDRQGAAAGPHRAVRRDGFHVHARLDRVAARSGDVRRIEPQVLQGRALRQPELGLHEVDAGHRLGDRVLDLKPRVRLDEDEGGGSRAAGDVDQELERAEVRVPDALREPDRRVDDVAAKRVVQRGSGSDLDDLLEAALDAAFALPEMRDAAVPVAEDLHLDVAGTGDELFDVDLGTAERGAGLGLAASEGRLQLIGRPHHARAATAAPGDRLDDHRAARAERGEEGARLVEGDGVIETAAHRDGRVGGGGPGARLVAEQLQVLHVRPDEGQPRLGAHPREVAALGEEAVAGVDGVAAGRLRRRDQRLGIQVGGRALSGQRVACIRHAHMQAAGVVLGMDGDGRYAEVGRGAGDADGDLAPVGDQQLRHAHGSGSRGWAIVRLAQLIVSMIVTSVPPFVLAADRMARPARRQVNRGRRMVDRRAEMEDDMLRDLRHGRGAVRRQRPDRDLTRPPSAVAATFEHSVDVSQFAMLR